MVSQGIFVRNTTDKKSDCDERESVICESVSLSQTRKVIIATGIKRTNFNQ